MAADVGAESLGLALRRQLAEDRRTGTFYGGADIYGVTNNANCVIENAGASLSTGR
ncbi:MAG: hypothetical protein WAK01_18255 [Methylocystis sp.]